MENFKSEVRSETRPHLFSEATGKQKSRQARSMFLLAGLLGAVGVFATACGNKDGGGTTAAVPGPSVVTTAIPTCAGCTSNMQFLVSAVAQAAGVYGATAPAMEIGLDFFGDPSILQQQGYGNPGYVPGIYQAGAYRGPVAASGYIQLNQALPCGIPIGRYQVSIATNGIFGNDGAGRSFDNLRLTVSGAPVQILMSLSGFTTPATPPVVGTDNRNYPYRFTATTLQLQRIDTYATCTLNNQLQ